MNLILTYRGELHAQKNDMRTEQTRMIEDKWKIRRQIGPQLKRFWDVNPQAQSLRAKQMFQPIAQANARFIPLIREAASLVCKLDVLFLRDDQPGNLIKGAPYGGDIDNRMKVLFDGLAMPERNDGNYRSGSDPDPFYCLLENDRLITQCSVRTERLLAPLGSDPSYAECIIDVTISASMTTLENLQLIGN